MTVIRCPLTKCKHNEKRIQELKNFGKAFIEPEKKPKMLPTCINDFIYLFKSGQTAYQQNRLICNSYEEKSL